MKKLILILFQFLFVYFASSQEVVKYTTANLNLREEAYSWANIVSVLPKGTAVSMEECNCEWIHVSYHGKTGYVASRYLSKSKPAQSVSHSKTKYYTNSDGERVQSPTYYNSAPQGATALCRDGTYSFSHSRRGTCSHHGGVSVWL
mgnify:CR=1 FL=1|jgi:uncharacterized protein YgiM (DUF1202 family)